MEGLVQDILVAILCPGVVPVTDMLCMLCTSPCTVVMYFISIASEEASTHQVKEGVVFIKIPYFPKFHLLLDGNSLPSLVIIDASS